MEASIRTLWEEPLVFVVVVVSIFLYGFTLSMMFGGWMDIVEGIKQKIFIDYPCKTIEKGERIWERN